MKRLVLFFVFAIIFNLVFFLHEANSANIGSAMRETENAFNAEYRSAWTSLGIDNKLKRAINEAVDDNTRDLMWGTVGIQLSLNSGGIVDKIQESISFKFNSDNESLLSVVERNFDKIYKQKISEFYADAANDVLSNVKNPLVKSFFREAASDVLRGGAQNLIRKVEENLSKGLGSFSSGKFLVGLTTALFGKKLITYMATKIGGVALAKGLGAKIAGSAVPFIGQLMMAWSVFDFATEMWGAEEKLKDSLYENFSRYMRNEVPVQYWNTISSFVGNGFNVAYSELEASKKRAESIGDNALIVSTSANMTDSEKEHFGRELVKMDLNEKINLDSLLNELSSISEEKPKSSFEDLMLLYHEKQQMYMIFGVGGAVAVGLMVFILIRRRKK